MEAENSWSFMMKDILRYIIENKEEFSALYYFEDKGFEFGELVSEFAFHNKYDQLNNFPCLI